MLSSTALIPLLSWVLFAWIAHACHVHIKRRALARRNGCEEPPKMQQGSFLGSFGYRMLRDSFNGLRNSTYLQLGKERFEENGSTYAFKQLLKVGILTNDPENVKAVLSSQFQDFGVGKRRADAFEPLIGHGIFTADGVYWDKARKLVRPSFNRDVLQDMTLFEPHVQAFLRNLPTCGKSVDLQPLFQGLSLDISTDFLCGESTNVLSNAIAASEGQTFAGAFDRAQRSVTCAFALGPIAWLHPQSTFKKDQKIVQDFMTTYVDKALDREKHTTADKTEDRYSFAEEFAKLTDDRAMIRGGLLNLLLAGRDGTASLLSNLFFMLARHPEVYARLAADVRAVAPTPDHEPTLEDLKSMKYLRACLNESLRLHPPIPRNSREALRDTTLPVGGGPDGTSPIFIPKGTQVGYQIFSLHRRKDAFGEDADDFVPERWTERGLRPGWAFLPFNGGPRICIGQQFALNLASYVLCRLVQYTDSVEKCSEAVWEEKLGISCPSKDGCWVRMRGHEQEGPTPGLA